MGKVKEKGIKLVLLMFIFMVIAGIQYEVDAKEVDEQPFTIQPVLPKNQDKGIYNYISLSTKESSIKQKVRFSIKNNTKETMEIGIKPLNALTSPSGVIDYYEDDERENSFIIKDNYRMSKNIGVIESIEVKSGETRFVDAMVDVRNVEGTILGGVGFQIVKDGKIEEYGDGTFQIETETNVIIGVRVNFNTEEKAKFIVDEPYVDPLTSYYVVRLPITLDAPLIASDVSIDYSLYDYKGKKLFGSNKPEFKFAPNTKVNIPLPWEADEIQENKLYTLKGTIEHEGEITEFDKGFVFKGDNGNVTEGRGFKVPNIDKDSIWWLYALLLALLLLLLLFKRKAVYVLYTDSTDVVLIIEKEHELFNKVKLLKDVKEEEKNYKYELEYKPVKKKREIVRYEYKKMTELDN